LAVEINPEDAKKLADFCRQTLGEPADWKGQVGYPESLALCVIDSIWSLAANYDSHVVRVLDRYRELRRDSGADPNKDSAGDLLKTIEELGGAEAFADRLKNHQRTSTRNGALKAEAIERAAAILVDRGIETPQHLLAAVASGDGLQGAWQTIPGQRSSLTGWRYLLLLAGKQEVKPDRMVRRFVADAIDRAVNANEAHALLSAAATLLGMQPRELDHQVWRYQSGRTLPDEPDEAD
jgi:hypothetical protein